MSKNNRFSKPVAFNKTNELDMLIFEHVKDLNFSGYVKELIEKDMNKKEEVPQVESIGVIEPEEISEQAEPIPEIEPTEQIEKDDPIQTTIEPIQEVVHHQPIEPVQPKRPIGNISEPGVVAKKEKGVTKIIIR